MCPSITMHLASDLRPDDSLEQAFDFPSVPTSLAVVFEARVSRDLDVDLNACVEHTFTGIRQVSIVAKQELGDQVGVQLVDPRKEDCPSADEAATRGAFRSAGTKAYGCVEVGKGITAHFERECTGRPALELGRRQGLSSCLVNDDDR